jgi:hypothetical protein
MAKKREKRECRAVVIEHDAAGIDIGAEEIYVAVPPDRDKESVRMFSSFTCDLTCAGRLAAAMPDSHGGNGVHWRALDSAVSDPGSQRFYRSGEEQLQL